VHGSAYSILKYLEQYNLQPPADHTLEIHTTQPASLEMYGSLFSSFNLRETSEQISAGYLEKLASESGGPVLYLSANAYPVKMLEPVFARLEKGEMYTIRQQTGNGDGLRSNEVALFKGQSSLYPALSGMDLSEFFVLYDPSQEFSRLLQYFFKRYQEESVPNQVKLIHHIDARTIEREKKQYDQLPFYLKWIKKLTGKNWNIANYKKKI
jgi:hypothetical protein